ncbi:hypothetical protein NQ315_001398 [Exocentrus adspersus]|uniref:Enkurin domain-containing protein n=1 Tax=Exocentrus adspersus TaxID=1586481 RepID=A0AAV8WFT3_9CUCU|nr:hypothetical protein NQ315_001398 [Exocentrus adspersus]
MSVILITKHDENIYNIVTTEHEEKIKNEIKTLRSRPPAYKSNFGKYRHDFKKCILAHATMGVPEEEPPDPTKFLRKRTGKQVTAKICHPKFERDACNVPKRAPVPTLEQCKAELAHHPPAQSKNFVAENVKEMKKMKPKEPVPKLVVDHLGTTKPLRPGFEPVFIRSSVFGKAPRYLLNIINSNKKKYLSRKDEDGIQKSKCRYITREERAQLLDGLKQNWEELQKQYQGLPILTDTIPKMVRKDRIESNLKQIEKDIQLIERHPYIYVYEDENKVS